MSPIPGFANWLLSEPDWATLPQLRQAAAADLEMAHTRLRTLCKGDLAALPGAAAHAAMTDDDHAALHRLCSAYLLGLSPTPQGDPVARFRLDNGARLKRINTRGNVSAKGLKQSFGMMVNYLHDLPKVEASHAKFRQGEVAHLRAISNPL